MTRQRRTVSDVYSPEALLPAQYWALRINRTLPPGKRLMLAVLENAVHDLQQPVGDHRTDVRDAAHKWVMANDWEWPFSFVNICEALGLSWEAIREGLCA